MSSVCVVVMVQMMRERVVRARSAFRGAPCRETGRERVWMRPQPDTAELARVCPVEILCGERLRHRHGTCVTLIQRRLQKS